MANSRDFHEEFAYQVARANAPQSWTTRADLELYNGEWTDMIWEAVRLLEQQCDSSSRLTRADTGTSRQVNFIDEVFAVAADGLNHDLSVISSGARESRVLNSDETHAERKILAAMSGRGTLRLFGGYSDTLFMFVTKSPCRACSQALVEALGPEGSGRYQHLVVAFLAYYSGPDPMRVETTNDWDRNVEKMPSEAFWQAVQKGDIQLFKPVWNDRPEDARNRKMRADIRRLERVGDAARAETAYDFMVPGAYQGSVQVTVLDEESGAWLPAPEPDQLSVIGRGGRPVDPRYQVIEFRPR